jgi:hypothetical protein
MGLVIDMGNDETAFQNMTVLELKDKIARDYCLDHVKLMRFLFGGKQLDDSKTLGSHDIENQSTLVAVIRVHGGLNVN